jgi:hypothetical protein
MAERRLKRPRDPIQLGKLIVDIATGQVEDRVEDDRDSAAAELGRKGGKARAERLTPEERREIAKKAARKRWGTPPIIAIRHSTEMAF